MKIFYGREIREHLSHLVSNMKGMICSEDRNQLLNCNESEYIQYFIARYSIELIDFDWDNISISDSEAGFSVDDFGRERVIECQVITYHVPYIGNVDLLDYKPSSISLMWTYDVNVNRQERQISFDIINRRNDPEEIKREFNRIKESITQQLGHLKQEIGNYNDNLERIITETVKNRKAELLKQSNMLASLGVPIKKKDSVPETFAIPTPIKKSIIKRHPVSTDKPFQPEPTLDIETYKAILKIIAVQDNL